MVEPEQPVWSTIVTSENATRQLAGILADGARPGDVLALRGSLGAGKTAFARAFVQRLMANEAEEVPSPTFTLLQTYPAEIAEIWHFDLYRLRDAEEVWELGFEDGLGSGILLIEWPDRIQGLLPARRLELEITAAENPAVRRIAISALGGCDWLQRADLGKMT